MNKVFALLPARVVAGVAGLAASAGAMAQVATFATPAAAVEELADSATGMGPIMFGIAVIATGIMIGVRWIKRTKSAS